MEKKFKIMIVDDNPANLKLAGDLLEIEEYEVIRCIDAESALEALAYNHPGLILMDIGLPGMDGLELTRILKSDQKTKDIKIIALTAFAMKSDKDKIFAAGCDGCITKPIDTRKFIHQINEYLMTAAQVPEEKLNPFKILLVDDNPTSLKLLKAVYETEGYEILTAGNGLEALEVLSEQKPDLIVTDVLMPYMDGYYLCYKIRTDQGLKDIPIIVYTATYTSLSEESVAKEMGADLFIRKPAPTAFLITSAKEILANTDKPVRKVLSPPKSAEVMHQYSSELINKLEKRNIELEETKENLQLTLKRFRQAQLVAHLGHWELDLSTQKVAWSEETFHILGLELYSVEPSMENFLKCIHPEDMERVRGVIEKSMQTISSYSLSHRIVQPNSRVRHLFIRGEFEYDKSANPLRFYGTLLDVTELVEKEEKLKEVNEELELFIYKSSHDLKGPIAALLGLVSLAKTEIKEEAALELISHMDTVTHKLKTTISQLLKIMHLRNRKTETALIDINELLDEIIDSLKYMNEYDRIQFSISNKQSQPIRTDKELISCVLSNIIENSVRYQRSDTVQQKVNIQVQTDDKKNTLIEIQDNGIGIPAIAKEKIFNMFYRGSEKSTGAGLGLYLAKNAIDKIQGTIEFTSEEDIGSTFKIVFPRLG